MRRQVPGREAPRQNILGYLIQPATLVYYSAHCV
jgi:hypothetical protein